MIITLDGPAAGGKSTIAQMLACDLSIMYLNTGLLYRALAYGLVHECSYTAAMMTKAPAIEDLDFILSSNCICYDYDAKNGTQLRYKNINIVHELKTPEVDHWASLTSVHSNVRNALLSMQRALGEQESLVVDGRDCGTVVFPHAEYKFFITATLEARAQRWRLDQQARQCHFSFEEACVTLQKRDKRDSTRSIAPLIIPSDAHIIDTTHLSLPDAVTHIKAYL